MSLRTPNIVVIGGGTGSFTLLQGLKEFTSNISAVVNMSDDGGSTGKLRDELGTLPPGDIRQCLVALSNLPEVRELFDFRFGKGLMPGMEGHSLGNVILSSLELQYQGDYEKAISIASKMLSITGQVIPVTLENHRLVMRDGSTLVKGQYRIAQRAMVSPERRVELEPKATINPVAQQAILAADSIVLAPGNLYGSLLPALCADGVQQTLARAKGKVVMVANLVNKPNQTDGWHVVDYVHEFEKYIGKGQIDYVLYNNQPPPVELLQVYAADGEYPVDITESRFAETTTQAIGAPLVSGSIYLPKQHDKLKRTLIRHDGQAVGQELMRLFYS